MPNVLKDVSNIDLSTTVMGQKLICHYSAPQQLYRGYFIFGEEAVAKAEVSEVPCLEFPPNNNYFR